MKALYITLSITIVTIPAVILRYIPFLRLVSQRIKRNLIFSYCICFVIQNILIYIYCRNNISDITPLTYKKLIFILSVTYVVISVLAIRGYIYQHLFVYGMQGGYSLILQTLVALFLGKSGIGEFSLENQFMLQTGLYILIFIVITIPLWMKIRKSLVFNYSVRDEYYWHIIWIIPMLIVYSDVIVTMNNEWINSWQQIVSRVMTGFALFFSWKIMNLDFSFLEEVIALRNINKIQHMKEVSISNQAKTIKENDNKIRILKHDMRHHLNLLSAMIRQENYEASLQLIEGLNKSVQNTEPIEYCKNERINPAFLIYINRAKDLGIKVTNEINIPETIPWNGNDLSILIANALENAIDASIEQEENKREIHVNTRYFENKLVIQIKNRYEGEIPFDKNGYPTTSKQGHGFGILSIRTIVDKHHGHMACSKEDDWFSISFMFSALI